MINKHGIYLLILILLAATVYKNRYYLFVKLDPQKYEDKYATSQYVLGDASNYWISDSDLYVYAGYAYWLGEDPTTINFEHPPVAKYLYGAFFHILGNPYWGSVFIYLLILILINLITKELLFSSTYRALTILLTGTLSLLQVHTRYALLELPLLVGVLFFFLSLFKLENRLSSPTSKKTEINLWTFFLGLSLGIILTVKYWFPAIILLISFLVIEVIKVKKWSNYTFSIFIGGLIYILSYSVYFFKGSSIVNFFKFEWYRFNWFMGKAQSISLLIFQTLFTGKFETPWKMGNYEVTEFWSILWPISFLSSIVVFLGNFLQHIKLMYLLSYSLVFLVIYVLGGAASDRFFIQLLPFWIIGFVFLLKSLINYYMFYDKKIV